MFGKGISREGDVLDLAVTLGLVNKSGSWFSYNGDKIGQGRENAKNYLKEHEEVMTALDTKIREHYNFDGSSPDGQEKEPVKEEKPAKKGRKAEKSAAKEDAGKGQEADKMPEAEDTGSAEE